MKLCMAGIDHVSAALEQREKLSLVRGQVQAVLLRIAERTGCAAVLLATCSRTELYLHAEGERVLPDAAEVLCEAAGAPACRPFLVQRTGGEAVRHLMQVSAGMQSQIFGDDQIVSQVKDAAALARELKTTDAVLDTLFRRAVTAGMDARAPERTETSKGFSLSPNFLPVIPSILTMYSIICSWISSLIFLPSS